MTRPIQRKWKQAPKTQTCWIVKRGDDHPAMKNNDNTNNDRAMMKIENNVCLPMQKTLYSEYSYATLPRLPFYLISTLRKHLSMNAPWGSQDNTQHCLRVFYSIRAPDVSIEDYVLRLWKYFQCSEECFVVALVYLGRMKKACPFLRINAYCVHRLVATALLLAAKFCDDEYFCNGTYAQISSLHLTELNYLECSFIQCIDWKFVVASEEYHDFRDAMANGSFTFDSHQRRKSI